MSVEDYYNNRPEVLDVEQLLEDAKIALHSIGRGIKISSKCPEREFLMFPSFETVLPKNKEGFSKVERDQTINFLHKKVGETSHHLAIIETDSVRDTAATFHTRRNYYTLQWDQLVGLYEAKVTKSQYRSSAATIFSTLPHTAEDIITMELDVYKQHFETDKLDLAQLEGLMGRFDEYSQNLQDQYASYRQLNK